MINYKDKPLEELNFNECIEFEKELLKKILNASRAGMSETVINQLQFFYSLLKDQKAVALQKEIDTLGGNKNNSDGVTIDTDYIESLNTDDEGNT
jgi:ribosomal 50S subunit-associated protein YjgA (DUF615 family)